MSIVAIAAGLLILALTVTDFLTTVLWIGGGGGFFTRRLGELQWTALLAVHRRRAGHRLLELGGVAITLSVILSWIAGLWSGWWLFYLGSGGIEHSLTGEDAGFWDTGWYAGNLLFTLGNGGFQPSDPIQQVVGVLTTMAGLGLITAAITYLMPVVQAVTGRRAIGSTIEAMGATPEEIILRAWNGENLRDLSAASQNLIQSLITLSHQHLTYPVLHYFHTDRPDAAFAPRLAALDEALTVACDAIDADQVPGRGSLITVRESIGRLLSTLDSRFVEASDDAPPPVMLQGLIDRGIQIDEAAYRNALSRTRNRRMLLAGLVDHDGWRWKESVWLQDREASAGSAEAKRRPVTR